MIIGKLCENEIKGVRINLFRLTKEKADKLLIEDYILLRHQSTFFIRKYLYPNPQSYKNSTINLLVHNNNVKYLISRYFITISKDGNMSNTFITIIGKV